MPSISDLLGNPLKDVMNSAKDIIGRFVADPDKKIEAQTELFKLQSDLQSKILDADVQFARVQADTLQTEMKSDSWMGKNWRPLLMLTFTYIILHNYVIAPVFHIPLNQIPDDMWTLLKIGMGGYIVGRTVEKVAPDIAGAVAAKKSDS